MDLPGLLSWKYRHAVFLAMTVFSAMAVLLVAYQSRWMVAVDVGSFGDSAFLSGFHADEADLGYRYRWTTGHAEVNFIGAGTAYISEVSVLAQGPRPPGTTPVTMTVSLNGRPLSPKGEFSAPHPVTLTGELQSYAFELVWDSTQGPPPLAPYTVSIDSSVFQPPGDARPLGVKIARVTLHQYAHINLPPPWIAGWLLVLVAGLYALLTSLPGRFGLLYALAAIVLISLLLILISPLYVAVYLPPASALAGILGLLAWQRERVRRWPEAVEAMRASSLPVLLMGAASLIYAVVALWALPQVDWIGHADYAENAVIARNLVSGKGLTVDYMAQFYKDYGPVISHPADTWPLLQPLLIAPFLALFGPVTWAAKLPNLLLLLGLAWAVFAAASRLWDRRVGLLAGLLTLAHPYFFNSVLYPINDLAFTLIFFALAWLVWGAFPGIGDRGSGIGSAGGPVPTPASGYPRSPIPAIGGSWRPLAIGVLAGLLVWSKPSGVVLLVGLGLWAGWVWRREGRGGSRTAPTGGRSVSWRPLLLVVGGAAVALLPLVARNLLAFGVPFFSTESYDAWVLRFWPLHDWEDIYKFYIGSELPHPRWVVGGKFGYQNLVDAIGLNFRWLWDKGVLGDPRQGDYVMGLLPLAGALVGLAALGTGRRSAGTCSPGSARALFGMVGLCLGLYTLFVLLYWHFEGRYFQVAVPWFYMLLAWGVFWIWDSLREAREGRKQKAESSTQQMRSAFRLLPSAFFLPLAVAALLWPSLSAIGDQIRADTQPVGFVGAMEWLKQHSTPQDVIMTRDPWELNWYTGRKAVMVPNDDLATIERVARRYGATMLQLGGPVDGINVKRCPGATGSRPALGALYCGEARPGYELVYRQGGLTIYRLSPAASNYEFTAETQRAQRRTIIMKTLRSLRLCGEFYQPNYAATGRSASSSLRGRATTLGIVGGVGPWMRA